MLCEKCNTEMNYFKQGQSCGWTCPNCGNGIVTSYVDDIQIDETIYSVTLIPNENISANDLKSLAKICHLNIITAKRLVQNGGVIFTGNAVNTLECCRSLNLTELSVKITPSFPYDI